MSTPTESKTISVSTGESIFIYDNFFPSNEQYYFETLANEVKYGPIFNYINRPEYFFLGCKFNKNDIDNIRLLDSPSFQKISQFIENKSIVRAWILANTSSSKYEYHTDWNNNQDFITLTYYINTVWDKNWGGETLFCNNYGNVELAIEYKPNRLIVFPSKLLHKPSMHSYWGIRYSLSLVFSPQQEFKFKDV